MVVVGRDLLGRERHRHPELLRVGGEVELAGHHADHRVGHAVERDVATDHAWVGAESSGPEAMAQHHDAIVAGPVLVPPEHPAVQRRDA
jgi:hypothetical protein